MVIIEEEVEDGVFIEDVTLENANIFTPEFVRNRDLTQRGLINQLPLIQEISEEDEKDFIGDDRPSDIEHKNCSCVDCKQAFWFDNIAYPSHEKDCLCQKCKESTWFRFDENPNAPTTNETPVIMQPLSNGDPTYNENGAIWLDNVRKVFDQPPVVVGETKSYELPMAPPMTESIKIMKEHKYLSQIVTAMRMIDETKILKRTRLDENTYSVKTKNGLFVEEYQQDKNVKPDLSYFPADQAKNVLIYSWVNDKWFALSARDDVTKNGFKVVDNTPKKEIDPSIQCLNDYFDDLMLTPSQRKDELLFFLKFGKVRKAKQREFYHAIRTVYPNTNKEMLKYWNSMYKFEEDDQKVIEKFLKKKKVPTDGVPKVNIT